MTTDPAGDALAAALIQLASHAEQIDRLDTREAAHQADFAARLATLAAEAASATARHTAIADALDGLDHQTAALTRQLADLTASVADESADAGGYQPVPAPRWWHLTGPERDTVLDRLRAWVSQIYQPSYGQLAAALPPCWEHHPICLYTLDWLSELWSALYLRPRRTSRDLAAQAEWQTRLLPAAAAQMTTESTGCQHTRQLSPTGARTSDP